MKKENVKRFIENLTEEGKDLALLQLLVYPQSRTFIEECIKDWDDFYYFPIDKKKEIRT